MNAVEIESAISELALQPFDAAEFPFSFLAALGNKETTIRRLRAGNNNASNLPGGVLQHNKIHIVVCEASAVGDALKALRTSPATAKAKAKYILATDGRTLEAEELASGETIACAYQDFPNHFGFLLPLAGISTIKEIKDNPIDVRATGRLNKLYVELLRENPDWATDERRADMNHFMARLVFCFFAEDTDIFNGEGMFTRTVDQFSERDGSNTHLVLSEIFRAMNIKAAGRIDAQPRLPTWANGFPYVNGGLFSGGTEVPRFTRMARTYLLHAGSLKWREINPDIFGSMIQAVADDEERGALGMHYTSVPNILKVLNPLFLDDLRAALAEAGDNERKLLNLRKRIARIRVFDPACGSGNFLVIAYKQMREIEAQINHRRGEPHLGSEIPLTNFRGIELRDFPAEIARLALIIAEFQSDVLYRGQKDALAEFLPLDAKNWIICGNALRLDWLSICPPAGTEVKLLADDLFGTPLNQTEIDFKNEGGETYICGNPPYLGSQWRSAEQQSDMQAVFSVHTDSYRDLDYVAAWFLKAAEYGQTEPCTAAFVATKSINQGRQVSMLWPLVFERGFSICFAHRPFGWKNMAANSAGVTVVIVGIKNSRVAERYIYDQETKKSAKNINAYLLDAQDVIVSQLSRSISGLPTMDYGNKPADGGNLILSRDEKHDLVTQYPEAGVLLKKLIGSREFTSSSNRWCLWIEEEQLPLAVSIPPIAARLAAVRTARSSSKGKQSQDKADKPHRFVYTPHRNTVSLVVPSITSENREYLPVGLADADTVVSNKAAVIYDPPLWTLSIVASRLHTQWIGTVCVRMRTDFSYSNTLGWNTFPVPLLTEQNKADLIVCAKDILLAREAHFPATIADLYDPDRMPDMLRNAHDRNDEVLERIYIGRRFKNDTERLEKLFDLYTKMTAMPAKAKPTAKATRRKTS